MDSIRVRKSRRRFLLIFCMFAFLFAIMNVKINVNAAAKDIKYGVIDEDIYRKTLCKGFLGKSYGTKIDGIRCDCSGYTKAALGRMKSKDSGKYSFKNYKIKARSSAAWVSGSTVTYTAATAKGDTVKWNKKATKKKIGKTSKNAKKVSTLKLGDVMVYKKGSYSNHVAIYFGKFDSAKDVRDYLVKLGIYKKKDLKKTSGGKYTYKGRTIIRSYSNSQHWRIHATFGGIMIDNDIASKSPYTSSYGKWKWTFPSGIRTK